MEFRKNLTIKVFSMIFLAVSFASQSAVFAQELEEPTQETIDNIYVGDADKGKKVFKKCVSCHKIGEDAKNSVGPVLNNIVGRMAGSFEGYKYGNNLQKAGEDGLVWDEEQLFYWMENPNNYLKERLDDKKAKSKMTQKLKKEEDRKNVIAYLLTLSEN